MARGIALVRQAMVQLRALRWCVRDDQPIDIRFP
jgi:hypothetical protein